MNSIETVLIVHTSERYDDIIMMYYRGREMCTPFSLFFFFIIIISLLFLYPLKVLRRYDDLTTGQSDRHWLAHTNVPCDSGRERSKKNPHHRGGGRRV